MVNQRKLPILAMFLNLKLQKTYQLTLWTQEQAPIGPKPPLAHQWTVTIIGPCNSFAFCTLGKQHLHFTF